MFMMAPISLCVLSPRFVASLQSGVESWEPQGGRATTAGSSIWKEIPLLQSLPSALSRQRIRVGWLGSSETSPQCISLGAHYRSTAATLKLSFDKALVLRAKKRTRTNCPRSQRLPLFAED